MTGHDTRSNFEKAAKDEEEKVVEVSGPFQGIILLSSVSGLGLVFSERHTVKWFIIALLTI